ncbi:hypothetical protein BC830DRAFT_1132589 [Chytriomyces sp. MP71]|nr:hypothetical protein BC830DRAFT_1132589 [Chytriomyces sp. MP71]
MDTLVTASQSKGGIVTATLFINNNFLASVPQPLFGQQQQEEIFTVSATFTSRNGVLLCSGQATVGAPTLACPADLAGTACLSVSCQTGISRSLEGSAIQTQFSVCPDAMDTCGNQRVAFGTITAEIQLKTSTVPAVAASSTIAILSKMSTVALMSTSTMRVAASSTTPAPVTSVPLIPGLGTTNLQNKDGTTPTGLSPALIAIPIVLVVLLAGGIAYYMYWRRFVVQEEEVQTENVSRSFDQVQEGRFKKDADVEASTGTDTTMTPAPPARSRIATPAPPGSVSRTVSPTSTVEPESVFSAPPLVPTQSYGFIYQGYGATSVAGVQRLPIATPFSNPHGAGYQLPPQLLTSMPSTGGLISNLPTGGTTYPGYYDINGRYHFYQ